ncbi:MAG: hypothetical protein ACRC14_05065, partial [Paracoccaceae bacterium]
LFDIVVGLLQMMGLQKQALFPRDLAKPRHLALNPLPDRQYGPKFPGSSSGTPPQRAHAL